MAPLRGEPLLVGKRPEHPATKSLMAVLRYEVCFSGRVQGVGFRHTTTVISREHPVTGYVQNMPDGTVRMVAEGETRELDQFVAAIRERMKGCIVDCRVDAQTATGEFAGFGVRI